MALIERLFICEGCHADSWRVVEDGRDAVPHDGCPRGGWYRRVSTSAGQSFLKVPPPHAGQARFYG